MTSSYNALFAMLEEASLTPKPGLVDMNNSGAHIDMNWFTMFKSALSIFPFFKTIDLLSFSGDIYEDWNELKSIGLRAEESMFEATGGINTHRGQIFLLGLSIYALKFSDTYNNYKDMMRESIIVYENKFPRVYTKTLSIDRIEDDGILPEIKRGFPSLEYAIDLYFSNLNDYGYFATLLLVLLAIMSKLNDTTTILRGGREALTLLKGKAYSLVEDGEDYFSEKWWKKFNNLDKWMVENKINAGGSADMLALFIFLLKEKLLKTD